MRGVRPGRRAADGCGDGRGGANDHPIEFAFQWDDAVAAREAGLALFDAFGSTEKTMHINPGPHGGIPRFEEAPFGTGLAKVEALSGVVRFKGAIATTGTKAAPFVLPAAYRPAKDVYVPIDMCNATNGRLYIQPTGAVTVQAGTSFSNAQCFTSLEGTSFVR